MAIRKIKFGTHGAFSSSYHDSTVVYGDLRSAEIEILKDKATNPGTFVYARSPDPTHDLDTANTTLLGGEGHGVLASYNTYTQLVRPTAFMPDATTDGRTLGLGPSFPTSRMLPVWTPKPSFRQLSDGLQGPPRV